MWQAPGVLEIGCLYDRDEFWVCIWDGRDSERIFLHRCAVALGRYGTPRALAAQRKVAAGARIGDTGRRSTRDIRLLVQKALASHVRVFSVPSLNLSHNE